MPEIQISSTLSEVAPIVRIDLGRLITSRLLIQGNSGSGKSRTIRRLLEQTHGQVQHLVIDPDGEYHTLREKFDYVLAGKGGDCPADVASAGLLARRLLELGVSAIIDISELGGQRALFVETFLEALMEAPREMWHDVLVVIDEAHKFAPEGDRKATAHAAVVDLMSRGRKRGFCGVLATQRISKLDKSAAAECNNKLIGRAGLDVDIDRAAKDLGMSNRDGMKILPDMPAGVFYAMGPAFSTITAPDGLSRPERVLVGPVVTTHPDSAATRGGAPTPPRETVRAILAQLASLPQQAQEEAKTVEQLRQRVRELENDLRRADDPRRADAALARLNEMDSKVRTVSAENDALLRRVQWAVDGLNDIGNKLVDLRDRIHVLVPNDSQPYEQIAGREVGKDDRREDVRRVDDKRKAALAPRFEGYGERKHRPLYDTAINVHRGSAEVPASRRLADDFADPIRTLRSEISAAVASGGGPMHIPALEAGIVITDTASLAGGGTALSRMQRAFLAVLAQHREGLPKAKLLLHADYAAGGPVSKCCAELARKGWVIATRGGPLVITESGLHALGSYTPLPTGRRLLQHILSGNRL